MSIPHHILQAARMIRVAADHAKMMNNRYPGGARLWMADYIISLVPPPRPDRATCNHLTFKYLGSGYHECLRCGETFKYIPPGGMLIYGHDCSVCRANAAKVYNSDGATPEFWALPAEEQTIVRLFATLHVERGREIEHGDIGL